jgi:hypothetical protein
MHLERRIDDLRGDSFGGIWKRVMIQYLGAFFVPSCLRGEPLSVYLPLRPTSEVISAP